MGRLPDVPDVPEGGESSATGTVSSDPYTVSGRGTVQFGAPSDSYTGTGSASGSDGISINSEISSKAPGPIEGGAPDLVRGLEPVPSVDMSEINAYTDPEQLGRTTVWGDSPDNRVIEPRAVDPTITRDGGYLLSDLQDMNPVSLDLSSAASSGVEVPEGLGDYISDLGNLSLGAEGIGISGSALVGFAKARLTDVGIGMLIQPLFRLIDQQSGNSWTSRMIQLSMATMGYFLAGDPFGLIAAPIGWAIQEFIQKRARLLDNDNPEAIKGKKFGYVREGNKWYPAVSESQVKDLGDPKSVLMMQYGDKLKWIQEKGTGKWVPSFEHVRYKEFSVDDKEIYGDEAGNEYRERADPLRDFWIMSDGDATQMLKNFAGGDLMRQFSDDDKHVFTAEEQEQIQAAQKQAFDSFTQHDGRTWEESWAPQNEGGNGRYIDGSWTTETDWYGSNYAPTVDSQQDSRAALDFIHDYRHSASGSVDRASGDFWEGSIQLRRLVNEQGAVGSAQWDAAPRLLNQNYGRPAYWDMPEGSDVGEYVRNMGLSKSNVSAKSYFDGQAENGFYLDQFKKELAKLYTSQEAAANAMGFKDRYKTGPDYDSYKEQTEHPNDFWWKNMIDENGWARLYHDNSWDMPDVKTAKQLHDELLDIEEAGDSEHIGTQHYRNTAQQHYLAQKAIVRYWAQKIDGLGGGPQLQYAWNQNPSYYANAPPPFWQEGDSEDATYSSGWHYGGDDVKNPIEGVGEYAQSSEDEMLRNVQQAMDGYRAMGITQGAGDPDYVAGRWDDFTSYWESTGRPIPEVDGVPQVWSEKYERWVAPSDIEDTGFRLPEWGQGDTSPGFDIGGGIPEGWTMQGEYAVAPDGTLWDPHDDLHMFPYDDDLKAKAEAAEDPWAHLDREAQEAEEALAKAEADAAAEADTEDPWAHLDREAQEAEEALAKADAEAAAWARLDREAQESEEALAKADAEAAGVTHTQGAEPEDPGHTNVRHESALFHFVPDKKVPRHIPTFISAAQAIAPAHLPAHIKSI